MDLLLLRVKASVMTFLCFSSASAKADASKARLPSERTAPSSSRRRFLSWSIFEVFWPGRVSLLGSLDLSSPRQSSAGVSSRRPFRRGVAGPALLEASNLLPSPECLRLRRKAFAQTYSAGLLFPVAATLWRFIQNKLLEEILQQG